MSENRENPTSRPGESELRQLLEAAGPRPEVPPAELAAIKASAREDWRRMVADRSVEPDSTGDVLSDRRRWGGWRKAAPLALAAALLVALSVGLWWRGLQPPPAAGAVVARVELAEGARRADGSALTAGSELREGAEIEAVVGGGDGVRVAIRMVEGQSVRLAADSRLRLVDESALELQRGAVYVDSAVPGRSLEVRTSLGSVRDIGTQFEVRLDEGPVHLRVRVREGSVAVEHGAESHSAVAGEELRVGADGSLDRDTVPAWGREWEWVMAAAPGPTGEKLYLDAYLAWLSRETGWQVRFADEALAAKAPSTEIFGDAIRGLSPRESLDVATTGSTLSYRLEDGVLTIER